MKKYKGITLIALVITIVILLILAGITIASLTQTGLFTKAKEAKEKTICSQAEEKVKLAVNASFDSTASLNKEMLKENLNKIEGINPKVEIVTYDLTVTVDGYKFLITESGQVTNVDKSEDEEDNQKHEEKNSLVLLEHFDDDKGIILNSDKITAKEKKVGNSSLHLDNTGCEDARTNKFEFDNDFTIEYWLKESNENLNSAWAMQLVVEQNGGIMLGLTNGKFIVRGYNVGTYLTLDPPPMDEWVHIAVTRKDETLYVFYNGILQGTTKNTVKFTNGILCIGSDGQGGYTKGNSYIDELKILNGVGKYTNNFSITSESDQYEDEIVYHFENNEQINENYSKKSVNNKKIGIASAYFNNTYTKYINKNLKLDKDFTVDYWVNQSQENLNNEWAIQLAVTSNGGIMLGLNNGKFVVRGYNDKAYLTIDPPPTGEWVHIAVTRKDGIIYVFYNGKLQKTTQNLTVFTNGNLYLAYEGTEVYLKDTYMDELRILNGYCAWTENFEVPSKPYEY